MNRNEVITIVSGLPRSGTSMLMSMLEAGGISLLVDGVRTADEDNPKGYFEFERVKKTKQDKGWLDDAKGKAVKMISQLLYDLPPDYRYKIVFVRRNIDEVLASQKQMLIRRGTYKEDDVADEKMRTMLLAHVDQVLKWIGKQKSIECLCVDYNRMLQGGAQEQIGQINAFLGGDLNTAAMSAVVDKTLYRQRKGAPLNT
ncbi:MAG TPA: sulfotransferase domain-containing protein [Phycisphaerae bacterium]|nr:sulfotransferase domain-containing protein [Phycisphaerae bacterium]